MYELYRKLIKEELEYNETINQMPKGDALEYAFKQLSIIDNATINTQIEKYRSEKEELVKQYNEINEKINNLINKYYDELTKAL